MVTTKTYYENNKEAIKAYQRDYRARNPEMWQLKNKLWREANPEKGRVYMARYCASPKGKLTKLKLRARKISIGFDIKLKDFTKWIESQKNICYYCGIELWDGLGQKKLNGLSIDRKDNTQGYFIENIVLCCNRCNMAKGSWFTEKQMLEIANKYFLNL